MNFCIKKIIEKDKDEMITRTTLFLRYSLTSTKSSIFNEYDLVVEPMT